MTNAFRARRSIALFLAGVLAFGASGCSRGPAAIGPQPDATTDPAALADRLDTAVSAVPPEADDLDARAAKLPAGLDAPLALARDEIRAESYSGVLLGASAAYRNRGANAIDRALVLGHLLEKKGFPIRFASCRLDPASAEILANAIFAPPPQATAAESPSGAPIASASEQRLEARGARDLAAVRSALGGAPAYAGMSHADLISELEDHTWVQAQQNGQWVDLDPSFPDAKPGKAYCTPASTSPAPDQGALQTVTIRVGAETLASGQLTQSVLLEQTFPAYALLGGQIYVAQVPGNALSSGLTDKGTYAPVLAVAGEMYPGTAVSFFDGAADHGAVASQASAINVIPDGSATTAGAAPSTAAPSAGPYLVAEWLEFTVKLPNGASDTTRRFLFDRGGSAWRASSTHDPAQIAPMAQNASGPLAAQSFYEIAVDAGGDDLPAYAAAVSMLERANASAPTSGGDLFTALWPFAIRNLGFGILSDAEIVRPLDTEPGVRFYADSPRIFVFGAGPAAGRPDGTTFYETDLRRDRIRGIARDPSGAAAVADGLLKFGVMEGALETELTTVTESVAKAGASFGSTSELLGPDGLTVLRPNAGLASVTDPETAARMRTALAAGATLVVPTEVLRGGPSGWWQVDADGSNVRAVYGPDVNASYTTLNPNATRGFGNYGNGVYDLSKAAPQRGRIILTRGYAPASGRTSDEYFILVGVVLTVFAGITAYAAYHYLIAIPEAQAQLLQDQLAAAQAQAGTSP